MLRGFDRAHPRTGNKPLLVVLYQLLSVSEGVGHTRCNTLSRVLVFEGHNFRVVSSCGKAVSHVGVVFLDSGYDLWRTLRYVPKALFPFGPKGSQV